MLRRVPVAVRLFGLVGLVVLFAAATFLCAVLIVGPLQTTVVNHTHEVMLAGEKGKIKAATQAMAVALEQALQSVPGEAERKTLIRQLLDPIRFEDDASGYFFVYEGTNNIALPPRPELVGQDLQGLVDADGVHYVRELARQAGQGGGFVAYIFPKPQAGEEKKLSYAQMIPGTDFWIGTGVYIDNVRREENRIAAVISGHFRQAATISALLFAAMVTVLCGVCLAIGYSVARPLAEATMAAEYIAAGNFDIRLTADGNDEAARLQAALNTMTGILRQDIQEIRSRRAEAEDKAELAQRALEQARQASQEVVAQAALRFKSLQQIAAAVAHQLRNPTTIIGGLAGLLQKVPSPRQNYLEYLDGIISAARRIEHIAKSVNEYSLIHLGDTAPVLAGDILEAGRRAGEDVARQLGLAVAWEIEGRETRLTADPALLAMAVREVAINAVEALPPEGGRVCLAAGKTGTGSFIAVTDTGKGIAPETIQFLLDPFYTTKSVGVGMGLTKAQRAMTEHGGGIAISSQPGLGATVTLSIPATLPLAPSAIG